MWKYPTQLAEQPRRVLLPSRRSRHGDRAAYVDTTAVLPGYVELGNLDALTDAFFTRLYAASLVWDGGDPIRSSADGTSA